ncbi:hypothetical protein [Actinoplanes subtropicus]|uniref:hypothetical protein n=1 Tax=Actinoplanes subtropicus TaxID=543632 RepID=UPI00068ABFA7|nr:hypothetical protein [Actinoplanes subtropicus]
MRSIPADGDLRLLRWLRVREFAVPPSMIETATARRTVGDWAGACAAARIDVDLDPRTVARVHGRELAALLRADLRHLAPDLLRWHLPRIAPDGLLRPGLTVALARYPQGPQLVVRTAPAWADSGQRISLALWDGRPGPNRSHPHARPDRRFRLDLHRHLWDARRAGDLRERSGAATWRAAAGGLAVHRWAAEAAIVRRAGEPVIVRVARRRRLAVYPGDPVPRAFSGPVLAAPLLPDAAVWVSPDLALLRAGLIEPGRLHPLVAAALTGDTTINREIEASGVRLIACGDARHRIGIVDGVLSALDHDPAELRREAALVALGGKPLPCLRAIDLAAREPTELDAIRGRLDHGDTAGALAVVEGLLGAAAALPDGALRDELDRAAERRVTHGLYRAGLAGRGPLKTLPSSRRR